LGVADEGINNLRLLRASNFQGGPTGGEGDGSRSGGGKEEGDEKKGMFGQAKQAGQLGKVTVRSHELGLVRHLVVLLNYNHCDVHSCTLSLRDQIYKPE
jgi:hypothetical protein